MLARLAYFLSRRFHPAKYMPLVTAVAARTLIVRTKVIDRGMLCDLRTAADWAFFRHR